jgi:hypothetical protein
VTLYGGALLAYPETLGRCFAPQPEQVGAAVHVVVGDLAVCGQEPAWAENRPQVRIGLHENSSL